MISNRAETGKLSNSPKISLRVKGPDTPSPTQRENQIYDSLQKALWEDPNVPEEIIMKDIAKQFNITVEKLKDIYAKVFEYRH